MPTHSPEDRAEALRGGVTGPGQGTTHLGVRKTKTSRLKAGEILVLSHALEKSLTVVFKQGRFCPPRGHLAMSGDISGCHTVGAAGT